MTILLDTVDFLWFVSGNSKLPPRSKQEITNPQNEVFLSVVSLWEIKLVFHSEPWPSIPGLGCSSRRLKASIPVRAVCIGQENSCSQPPAFRLGPNSRPSFDQTPACGRGKRRARPGFARPTDGDTESASPPAWSDARANPSPPRSP